MAAGKPIVAARSAAVLELVRDGVDGLLVKPRNPEELASALARLRDDPALRTKLASNAAKRVEEFCRERVCRMFLGAVKVIENVAAAQ
jgi:glycosyltransferase involved in cell wall biosynthesis